MISLRVFSTGLKISIPTEIKAQAQMLLKDIWRTEFEGKPDIVLELTDDSMKVFVETMKLHPQVLVYC